LEKIFKNCENISEFKTKLGNIVWMILVEKNSQNKMHVLDLKGFIWGSRGLRLVKRPWIEDTATLLILNNRLNSTDK
jgi:hypothetical protein